MNKFSRATAISVVVANMIGTGVFTSLGYQLVDIQSPFVIMMLWIVGGLLALCGALTYAELGASLPRSGGEYHFLSRLYHPGVGFVAGWVSITVGFSAPIALAAMTFAAYLQAVIPSVNAKLAACLLVMALTVLHCASYRTSGNTQVVFTAIKIGLIIVFSVAVLLFAGSPQDISLVPAFGDTTLMMSGAFAVSLIYVNYAYTGWNAATYICDELDDPRRDLPLVLVSGTAVVVVVYLLLNYVFLYAAPIASMTGRIEVGVIAADAAFGDIGGRAMGLVLALLLISTVSAMLLAGPRVLKVIGEDFPLFRVLSITNANELPVVAIGSVGVLSLLFILTSTFESVLVFSGFVLGISTLFTVAGVFLLRFRGLSDASSYRTIGYPVTPLIYIGIMIWTLTFILMNRPEEGWAALAVIAVGIALYLVSSRFKREGGST